MGERNLPTKTTSQYLPNSLHSPTELSKKHSPLHQEWSELSILFAQRSHAGARLFLPQETFSVNDI